MSTLLLRLAAPMQSWGDSSKFEIRGTGREPTKSGVIGMLAAALGISREDSDALIRLNALHFGIRVDREGKLLRDFHIAINSKTSYVTYRDYLSDAVFLAGLETDETVFLEQLEYALTHPVYPLYLGRRSCPVTLPLVLGIRETSLADALRNEPPLADRIPQNMRIQYDAPSGNPMQRRQDVPQSFSVRRRIYGYRVVAEEIITTEHDPMAEL